MGFCTSCGAKLADGSAFCTNCGKKITPQSAGGPAGGMGGGYAGGAAGGAAGGMGGQTGGASGQNNGNNGDKKKNPLVPFLIAFGSALVVLGTVILMLYLFKVWPFDGERSDNKPAKQTTEADDPTERTKRADKETKEYTEPAAPETREPAERTTEPRQSESAPPETQPTYTEPPYTEPTYTEPAVTEPYFNEDFLGVWYGDQGTVFTLFGNGSVQYDDGGVDKNRLTGTWTLDEETGLFELDLFGGGNRFYLYVKLPYGSDSTVMENMAMNWNKSTVDVWYYESFFRERPATIIEGEDRVPQVKPYMP